MSKSEIIPIDYETSVAQYSCTESNRIENRSDPVNSGDLFCFPIDRSHFVFLFNILMVNILKSLNSLVCVCVCPFPIDAGIPVENRYEN